MLTHMINLLYLNISAKGLFQEKIQNSGTETM